MCVLYVLLLSSPNSAHLCYLYESREMGMCIVSSSCIILWGFLPLFHITCSGFARVVFPPPYFILLILVLLEKLGKTVLCWKP